MTGVVPGLGAGGWTVIDGVAFAGGWITPSVRSRRLLSGSPGRVSLDVAPGAWASGPFAPCDQPGWACKARKTPHANHRLNITKIPFPPSSLTHSQVGALRIGQAVQRSKASLSTGQSIQGALTLSCTLRFHRWDLGRVH
jgi:hypothetical protein